MKNHFKKHVGFYSLLFVYIIFGLLTLTKYPRIHDDEGILRQFAYSLHHYGFPIIDRTLSHRGTLEEINFFPIAGIIYYSSLSLWGFFGFDLFSMRGHSFFCSVVVLIMTYRIGLRLFSHQGKALFASFLVAFSAQFLHAAHLVRQESMLIAALLIAFDFFIRGVEQKNIRYLCVTALISGSSMSIHPNGMFFPLVFLSLYFWESNHWQEKIKTIPRLFVFVLLGYSIFIFLDYWPYREDYFKFVNNDLISHLMHRQSDSMILGFLRETWRDFWVPRYHRHIAYLIIYFFTVVGAFFFRHHKQGILAKMLCLILLMLVPLHSDSIYLTYFVPFFALLTASVFFEIYHSCSKCSVEKMWKIYWLRSLFLSFLVVYGMLYCLNLWAYRDYDYRKEVAPIIEKIPPDEFVLANSAYVFLLPQGKNYSTYLIANYEIEKLKESIDINYIVVDKTSEVYFSKDWMFPDMALKNGAYLQEHCELVAHTPSYRENIFSVGYFGDFIRLYYCPEKI